MIGEVKIPRRWFKEWPTDVGMSLEMTFRARITKIEAGLIDVTPYGKGQEYAMSETFVTLSLDTPRIPLSQLEKWAETTRAAENVGSE